MWQDAVFMNLLMSTAVLLGILYLDRHEKEPFGRVALLLAIAVIATVSFGQIKGMLLGKREFGPFVEAFLVAGFLEELLKFSLLACVVTRWKSLNETFDLLVYIGVVAVGFQLAENIGYFLHYTELGARLWLKTGDQRIYYLQLGNITAARAIPGHVLFDFVGARLWAGLKDKGRGLTGGVLGFCLAVFLHGTWNTIAGDEHHQLFLCYLFVLTLTASWAVYSALRASRFRLLQERLRAQVEHNVYIARKVLRDSDPMYAHRLSILEELSTIARRLAELPRLQGEEQESAARAFDRRFPSPLTDYRYEGPDGIRVRLKDVREELETCLKQGGVDWTWWALSAIALAGAAFLSYCVAELVWLAVWLSVR